jgi:hypothetical protein
MLLMKIDQHYIKWQATTLTIKSNSNWVNEFGLIRARGLLSSDVNPYGKIIIATMLSGFVVINNRETGALEHKAV